MLFTFILNNAEGNIPSPYCPSRAQTQHLEFAVRLLHFCLKVFLFLLSSPCLFGPFWIVIFIAAQILQNCSTHNVVLIRQFAGARWDACRELFGSFQCVIWTKQLNQWASLWCSLWGLLSNGSYNGRAAEPGSSVLCVMVMLGECFWAGRECVWNKKVCVL